MNPKTANSKQTHATEEFHLDSTGTREIPKQFASAVELFGATQMKDADLRRLADPNNPDPVSGQPWIPKPVRGKYEILPTLAGIIRWLRAQLAKSSDIAFAYASMDAFSSRFAVSKQLLSEMKRDACPGFHASGRINLLEWLAGLEPWLAGKSAADLRELEQEGVSTYQEMREKYQARNEKHKYAELRAEFIAKTAALESVRLLQSVHFHALDRMSEELPAALAGRDAAHVRKTLAKFLADIRATEKREIARLESLGQPDARPAPVATP